MDNEECAECGDVYEEHQIVENLGGGPCEADDCECQFFVPMEDPDA